MTFSVVVAWRGSAENLRRCLQSLDGQGADQVVVSYSLELEPSDTLVAEFPSVEWLQTADFPDLPELFWKALGEVWGEIVGMLESPSIAGPNWIESHLAAHAAHPEVLSIGGPVRPPTVASVADFGWHWSEFAAYAPGRVAGTTRDLTDANVSYKREILLEFDEQLVAGSWGWQLRQVSERLSYFEPGAWIEYPNPFPTRSALSQHIESGRKHAAAKGLSAGGRLVGMLSTPLMPAVLIWRGGRCASNSGCASSYWSAVPSTLLFHFAWALGELIGYSASQDRN